MKGNLYENVLGPLLARIGTIGAGYLTGVGVSHDNAQNLMIGVSAAVLIGIDLLVGAFNRRSAKQKAVEKKQQTGGLY